jgi:hypothetical protein
VKAFGFKRVKRFHPDDALFLLAPFTWLGWLAPILVAASVCTPIFCDCNHRALLRAQDAHHRVVPRPASQELLEAVEVRWTAMMGVSYAF